MAQKIVGIDLGNDRVKACLVSVGLRRSQVIAVYEAPVEDVRPTSDDEADLDDLGRSLLAALRLLRDNGLMHHPAAISLPGSAASYRSLGFPFSDSKRIAQAVAFEIDGQFPVPADELVVDHIAVPPSTKGGSGRALVVAVRAEIVERINEAFSAVSVELRLITVGALATAQTMEAIEITSLIHGEEASEEPTLRPAALVVDIGHRSTEIVALSASGPIAARTLRRGGYQATRALARAVGIDMDSAEVSKHQQGAVLGFGEGPRALAEALTTAMLPVLREIEHTRQWLRTECGCEVTEVRLAGGASALNGLSDWMTREIALPVLPAVPALSTELRGVELLDHRSLVALGAGLGAGRRPLLQLRDLEATTKGVSFIEDRFGTMMTLGVAVLAFAGVQTVVHVKALEDERAAYDDELAAITSELFGEELMSEEDVQLALMSVEGSTGSRAVPERGALEVLALVSRTLKPTQGPAAGGVSADGSPRMVPIVPADGQPGLIPAPPEEAALPPVAPDAGLVYDDELTVTYADIRELKLKMIVTAKRATAQDRLALKFEDIACVSSVQKGKIRDVNTTKQFEVNLNHGCYRGSLATGANNAEAEPGADEEEGDE